MKKILLSLAAVLMIGAGASAQDWGWGPKVGFTAATVNGVEMAKSRFGVTAGVFVDKAVSSWVSIESDLLYSMNGYRFTDEDGVKNRVNLDYIYMPVVTKWYVMGGLNLQLGAQFGYLVGSKVDVDSDKYTIRDGINRFDVNIVAGAAYDFNNGMIVEGRYNIGATKVFRIADSSVTNGSLVFSVGWRF